MWWSGDGRSRGFSQSVVLLRLAGLEERPDIDPARQDAVVGVVLQIGGHAARHGGGEGAVHRGEDGGGGAEGVEELAAHQRVQGAEAVLEMGAHPVEGFGIGALEGVDRLLLVADDEEGALAVWCGRRRRRRTPGRDVRSPPTGRGEVSCASSTRMWSIPPSSRTAPSRRRPGRGGGRGPCGSGRRRRASPGRACAPRRGGGSGRRSGGARGSCGRRRGRHGSGGRIRRGP
jgi:hypothetical protein